MKLTTRSLLLLIIASVFGIAACNKSNVENRRTLKQLYNDYKSEEINACKINGEVVYTGEISAYDAGMEIRNKDGNPIGTCSYAWNKVDEICKDLEDCEVIYRSENNIWGKPPVDKYKLGK